MKIEVIKTKIITPENIHEFKMFSDTIEVFGTIPNNSFVFLKIKEVLWEFNLYLEPVGDNKFQTTFLLPEKIINVLKFKEEPFHFELYINEYKQPKLIPFKINFKSLLANGKTIVQNEVKLLRQEIIRLEHRLSSYMSGVFRGIPMPEESSKPGMVPIIVDELGNYIWDFPFSNLEQTIKSMASVLSSLSKLCTENTEKINELELELFNYKNQSIL